MRQTPIGEDLGTGPQCSSTRICLLLLSSSIYIRIFICTSIVFVFVFVSVRILVQASLLPPGSFYSFYLQAGYCLYNMENELQELGKNSMNRSKLTLFFVDCTICFALVRYCVECSLSKSAALSIGRSERALVMDRLGSVTTGVTYAFSSSSTTMMVMMVVMVVMVVLLVMV